MLSDGDRLSLHIQSKKYRVMKIPKFVLSTFKLNLERSTRTVMIVGGGSLDSKLVLDESVSSIS